MLREGLKFELCDLDAEDAKLTSDYLWHEVEIVIGHVPTVLKILFRFLQMSLGRILLQGSVSMNLFSPMRHQLDLWTFEV